MGTDTFMFKQLMKISIILMLISVPLFSDKNSSKPIKSSGKVPEKSEVIFYHSKYFWEWMKSDNSVMDERLKLYLEKPDWRKEIKSAKEDEERINWIIKNGGKYPKIIERIIRWMNEYKERTLGVWRNPDLAECAASHPNAVSLFRKCEKLSLLVVRHPKIEDFLKKYPSIKEGLVAYSTSRTTIKSHPKLKELFTDFINRKDLFVDMKKSKS